MLEDIHLLERRAAISRKAIRALLLDPAADLKLRSVAAWAAAAAHEESLADILEGLTREEQPPQFLLEVAKALGRFGRGAQSFRRLLREAKEPQVRQIAAYALGQLRDRMATNDLCHVAVSSIEDADVRAQAAESLGYIGDKDSVACLLEAARDSSPKVRFWAVFSLGQLRDVRAVPILERLERDDHATVEGWWEISREATAALAEIRLAAESK